MKREKSRLKLIITASVLAGIVLTVALEAGYRYTSRNDCCMSCHFHEEADKAWKKSVHCNNESGTITDCAACHLPPEGSLKHFVAKARFGIKDIWSFITKKKEDIDWASKGELEYAKGIVSNESCMKCHVNVIPAGLSNEGITAHLHFEEHYKDLDLSCISCHLDAGHFNPDYSHAEMTGIPRTTAKGPVFETPCPIESFANYTETIPDTRISINMIAIPGGEFTMGSPENEKGRKPDEGPQARVKLSRFFMAETEISWDQFWAFYAETMSEGRTPPRYVYERNSKPDLDAVTGPTPPFGSPDQGWGMGNRPAITMTHYSAETFCQWLSLKTGKTYRLPTEAEWEYAARGGSDGSYFVEGNAKKAKKNAAVIGKYVIYSLNSKSRTAEPSAVQANPFGLKNMLGNVAEYCSDWYSPTAYKALSTGVTDPKGPAEGKEYVVRGGNYASSSSEVRCASRACTHYDEWLRTDPQNPKSIWWFSDYKGIGFRVVCEVPENIQ